MVLAQYSIAFSKDAKREDNASGNRIGEGITQLPTSIETAAREKFLETFSLKNTLSHFKETQSLCISWLAL